MIINTNIKPLKEFEKIFSSFAKAEGKFKEEAIKKGWNVLRSGWPDFLIYKADQLAFVEVKDKGDRIRGHQKEMLTILSKFGFKCYIWKPDKGFKRFK